MLPPSHGGQGWLRPWLFKRRLVGVRATARARWHKATSKRGRSFNSAQRVGPLRPGKKNLINEKRLLPLGSDGVDTYEKCMSLSESDGAVTAGA